VRGVSARRVMVTPSSWSKLCVRIDLASAETGDAVELAPDPGELAASWREALGRATPPPGNIPSSTVARVALGGRIVVSVLLLTDFNLGSTTDLDDSDATRKLSEAFLKLRAVKFGCGGVGDDSPNLLAVGLEPSQLRTMVLSMVIVMGPVEPRR